MILSRLLLRLPSAVLPLLLLVVVAAGADVRLLAGPPIAIAETAVETPAAKLNARNLPRTIIFATTDLDVDDETELRVASTAPLSLVPARRLAIVSTIASDHPTPSRHRPCAAPPTGPPHA